MADTNTNPQPTQQAPEAKPQQQKQREGKKKEKKDEKEKYTLKTPKGTRDYDPVQMAIREKLFKIITNCFKTHGAVTIETPLFELKETLTGKYGEDSKLIYDLQDQGGELCSLRYDLTVPFARYVAMNRIKQIKRYQIGRVYRRDNPVMTKGRYREFYQCDFDIAGEYDTMVPDSEALKVITEILDAVAVGNYVIKVNHRKLLDGIFAICGVPEDKFRAICSSVDKLDKTPWDEVRKEMVEIKHLDPQVADKIQTFVSLNGNPKVLLKKIVDEKMCEGNEQATKALAEMELLFDYLDCYGVLDKVLFDLSLARGLDYYTGVIYEGILTDANQVGSICGGGRYDNLVGIFGESVPCVGFSIGIERLFAIMEARAEKAKDVRATETEVFVASIDKELLKERMKLAAELWKAGVKAEFTLKANPKIQQQLTYANTQGVPLAIIFGKNELQKGSLMLKDLKNATQTEIQRANVVEEIKSRLAASAPSSSPSVTDNNNQGKN